MKKPLTAIAAIALIGTPALAADLGRPTYKAPPPAPPPVYSWTGCYVGANAGGIGGGSNRYDLSIGGGYLVPPNVFSSPANQAILDHSYSSNDWGFTGGGQAGCNYQIATWVWGIEGDFNGSSLRQSVNGTFGPFTPVNGGGLVTSSHSESATNDIDWFATVRGRLGYAWDNWMLYGTGGLAVAQIKSSTNVVFLNDQFFLSNANFSGSATSTRTGWTAGGGLEWMFDPHWTAKVEYLYLDFGSFSYSSLCPSSIGSCNPSGGPALWNTHITTRANVVRLGLNYKFY